MQIIEITSIPKSELLSNDSNQSLLAVSQCFENILIQIGSMGYQESLAIDLTFLSDNNNTSQGRVKMYLTLRELPSAYENRGISQTIQSISSQLSTKNYITKSLDQKESAYLSQKICGIANTELNAIVKSEKIITSPISYTGYYYFSDLFLPAQKNKTNNFSSLFKALSESPDSFVSFQLVPTYFQPQEEYVLRDMATSLQQTVGGIFTNGQMIKEPYAEAPYKTYSYYTNMIGQPLFLYNIVVGSASGKSQLLTSQLMATLQSSANSSISLEALNIRENQQLSQDYVTFPWQLNNLIQQYYRNPGIWGGGILAPVNLSRLPFIISSKEAAIFFRLPVDDGSIVGVTTNRVPQSNEMFKLAVVNENNILFGELKGQADFQIGAPEKAFTQHSTIVGVPGTGKTTFAINLLTQFYKKGIPFLAIEPTKREYRAMLDIIPDLQIFTPGNNDVSPFIINPFIPPKGVKIEQYIPSLASAFTAAFSMPEPLDIIFLSTIRKCYTDYGWKDYSQVGDVDVRPFGLYEFILTFKKFVSKINYSAEVKSNIQSGGILRLMNLIEQNSNIYDSINTVPLEDLLCKPTLIELNAIDNEEYKSLLMALLLINICVYAKQNQESDGELKNVLLIDEAHVLLDSHKTSHDEKSKQPNSTITALQNMVAEIRALGTGIIIADQSPRRIGKNIIANTDIKIIFRLVGGEDRDIVADSVDMSQQAKQYLSHMDTGEAYIYYRSLDNPQLITTPDIRKQADIRQSISNSEVRNKMTYWEGHGDLLIPYNECRYSRICQGCSFKTRSLADFYANKCVSNFSDNITSKETLIKYIYLLHELIINYEANNPDKANLKRLCNCVKIKFLRKMLLSGSIGMTNDEIEKLLKNTLIGDDVNA